MEDEASASLSADLLGSVIRPPSVRVSRSFRTTSFNRSAPAAQLSPSFRRPHSVKTPRKDEGESFIQSAQWFLRFFTRRLPWLVLIGLWIFLVFKMYSNGSATFWRFKVEEDQDLRQHISRDATHADEGLHDSKSSYDSSNSGMSRLARDWLWTGYLKKNQAGSRSRRDDSKKISEVANSGKRVRQYLNSSEVDFKNFQSLKAGDYFLGNVVGPYDKVEQQVFGPKANAIKGSCVGEGRFAEFAKGKRVVLLMHELSMTGSPLAMMELASEILNCGGKVSVVVLDRRGGLLNELIRRRIPVLRDKTGGSWKVAAKAHIVVAGSAVCASWIDAYLSVNKGGASRVVWWVMENRREYFNRSKNVLGKVRALIFLSKLQAAQWEEWSKEENIRLPSQSSSIVPLSVNDAIASAAGLAEDAPKIHTLDRVRTLREAVRTDMGLLPNDTLFVSLSSINSGKGQLMTLHAASIVVNELEQAAGKLKQDKLITPTRNYNHSLKLLIGSVGSKSNKEEYVEKMLDFITQHPALTRSILWTPATVCVSSLYAAADVYLMNAQGIGETFGRVTVEAMAFGLPVLGTDAGGTREIVDANSTGLLHPVGIKGAPVLADNMLFLVNNPTLGREMGDKGRNKVKKLYTKAMMYEKLALVFMNSTSSTGTTN